MFIVFAGISVFDKFVVVTHVHCCYETLFLVQIILALAIKTLLSSILTPIILVLIDFASLVYFIEAGFLLF